jgi:predicted ATPase
VEAILEEGEVAPELRQLILNRATGNPLFMEEFTQSLLENGSIERRAEKYVLSRKPEDIQVPDTIQGIIAARVDRLEENLKKIMQVASVIGREFAFRILQTITGLRDELKSYLLNLQGLEFIYEKRLFPELEYIFKHALTQEVAYNSLLLKRRKEIHGKIALAIVEIYAERLEEFYEMLAYHYSRSEDLSKACHYLKLSGDKARGRFSSSEAFGFFKEALSLLRDQPVTNENNKLRLEILQSVTYPVRILGYPEGSLELLKEGESLAQDLEDRKALAYFQSIMSGYYRHSGTEPEKGREYIENGLVESELTEEIEVGFPRAYNLITAYTMEGKYSRVCEVAPKIIGLIEKTHTEHGALGLSANPYSILHGYYGMSLGAMGRLAEGERIIEKGLCFARDENNPISLAVVEMLYGVFALFKFDPEKMVKHWRLSTDYLERARCVFCWDQYGPGWARHILAWANPRRPSNVRRKV